MRGDLTAQECASDRRAQVARKNEHQDSHAAHDLEGRYANYFKVGYNAFEFVLDFGQYYTEDEGAQLHTRIVTGPSYAKALLEFLQDCIDKYELDFGVITGDAIDGGPHLE
jgi:Protein of unknown function (DUF3467)